MDSYVVSLIIHCKILTLLQFEKNYCYYYYYLKKNETEVNFIKISSKKSIYKSPHNLRLKFWRK